MFCRICAVLIKPGSIHSIVNCCGVFPAKAAQKKAGFDSRSRLNLLLLLPFVDDVFTFFTGKNSWHCRFRLARVFGSILLWKIRLIVYFIRTAGQYYRNCNEHYPTKFPHADSVSYVRGRLELETQPDTRCYGIDVIGRRPGGKVEIDIMIAKD